MLRTCWTDSYTGILPDRVIKTVIETWQNREALLRGILNPAVLFAGYVEDGRLLGIVRAAKSEEGTLVVSQLYVLPLHQRRGIGKKLMDHALNHFRECKKVVLEVAEGNQKGISFYRKYGFAFPRKTVMSVGEEEIHNLEGELLLP